MKISTKVRYGLRALVYIAENNQSSGKRVRIKEVSEKQKISIQYLEQILYQLKKAKIIEGKRGPAGGYQLMANPETLTVLDLYRILDSEIKLVNCNEKAKTENCLGDTCRTSCLWYEVNDTFEKILRNKTLKDLMVESPN